MRRVVYTGIAVLSLSLLSLGETPEKVAPCKLKNDPGAYNHKLVEIEGFISHGFENFTLFDPNCPYSPEIWFDYGGTMASGTIYCCGPSDARNRPKELVVDRIPVPLTDDDESHVRDDLDYGASPDQPDLDKLGCGTFQGLQSVPSTRAAFDIQHRAEAGKDFWVFDDPKSVAVGFLTQNLRIDQSRISGIVERKSRGRVVYQWQPPGKAETYMVVVSRPYWLSFYAEDETKVAWIVIAAYKSCGD